MKDKKRFKEDPPHRFPGGTEFLKSGDVVQIERGMRVYMNIPERFAFSNRRDSSMSVLTQTDIVIGRQRDDGQGHRFRTGKYVGRYVVIETTTGGGGTGMGPHDVFPNGYMVRAQKLAADETYDEGGVIVSFYQSGCFSAMLRPWDIQSVAKMKRIFVPA